MNVFLKIANVIMLILEAILGVLLIVGAIEYFLDGNVQDGFLILIFAACSFIWFFIDIGVRSHIGIKGRNPIEEVFFMKLGSLIFMFGLSIIPLYGTFKENIDIIFGLCWLGVVVFVFPVYIRSKSSATYDNPGSFYNINDRQFKGYCAESFINDVLEEYSYVKGEKRIRDMSKVEREQLKLYACMPIIYFYRWLLEMGFVNNPKGLDVLELLKKNKYCINRAHLSKDIMGFVEHYYTYNKNYEWLDDYYMADYYCVVYKKSRFYYVNEYKDSDYYELKSRIDAAYARYQRQFAKWQLVSDIEDDEFKYIEIYTCGDVNRDYVNACLKDYAKLDKTAFKQAITMIHIYEPVDSCIAYNVLCRIVDEDNYARNCEFIISDGRVVYSHNMSYGYTVDTHSMNTRWHCDTTLFDPNKDEALYMPVISKGVGGDRGPDNTMYLPQYFVKYKEKLDTFCEYHKLHSMCDIVVEPYYEEGVNVVKRLSVVMKEHRYNQILAVIKLWGV